MPMSIYHVDGYGGLSKMLVNEGMLARYCLGAEVVLVLVCGSTCGFHDEDVTPIETEMTMKEWTTKFAVVVVRSSLVERLCLVVEIAP